MDRWMRILLFGAGVAMLMLASGRRRVVTEASMTHALELPNISRRRFTGLSARIGAIASTLAAEQTLALRATDRAALPRRRLSELRTMYVRPLDR